jgi:hypothetical protein
MAELAQSLATDLEVSAKDAAWLPFEEVVQAHRAWQDGATGAEDEYRRKLAAFEDKYGEIVESYWCSSVASAIALTSHPAGPWKRLIGRSPRFEFHRVSDWATKNQPDVAGLLHTCDALAVKVDRVIRGPARRILMRLVTSSASHVLSLVDEPSQHRKTGDRHEAVEFERKALADTARYYEEVGLRQAQMVYFGGMLIGATLIAGGVGVAWWLGASLSNRTMLAIILGAIGALISVMERMANADKRFNVDYELGWMPVAVFGSFRPLIGAAFGLVVYEALASGLISLKLVGSDQKQTAFYAVLSFAGGFSERLAKDVLDAAEKTVSAAIRSPGEGPPAGVPALPPPPPSTETAPIA